jgi:hypothetical protein
MGSWGTGSFENDDAANWIAELGTIVPDDLAQILVQAADYPNYLEAPASRIAVAAAFSGSFLQHVPATPRLAKAREKAHQKDLQD